METSLSRSEQPRPRRRAPTITIDTSGLINNCTGEEDRKEHKQHECVPRSRQATPHDENMDVPSKPPLEPHAANSLDSRESRPTSPHNVSSPTWSWGNSHNFLLVPGTGSRGNSLDATTENSGSASIGTYVTSSQGETLQTLRGYCNSYGVLHDEDALKPDPGTEADFEVENNKFAFSPGQLSKLLNPKSLGAFYALGGLEGLEKGLRTNRQAGLSVDEQYLDDTTTFEATTPRTSHTPSKQFSDQAPNCSDSTPAAPSKEAFADRKRVFSDNRLPERKPQSIQLAWMAYNNKALILLTAAAVISLALGLYQTFSVEPKPGTPKIEWIEGVSIIAAIAIIVIAGVLNDQQKERQFVRLNKKRDDRTVKIVRSGKIYEISVFDVVVGDVLSLEPGDIVPVDGILISGHGIKCDESSATGESDLLKKTPGDDVLQAIENHKNLKKLDPFILSGAKVVEGVGSFLVTAVGIHSSYGKVMMSLREDAEVTPLQSKLNVLAKYIAKLGSASALLLFVVVLIKFLVHLCTSAATPAEKSQNFLNILTVVITVVIVAVPERLPLAITWALAFATTRMLRDNNLVRLLRSCETMGNATTICSGKTGTLMQNKTTVISGALGTALRFGDRKFKAPVAKSPSDDVVSGEQTAESPVESTSDVSPSEFVSTLSEEVKNLLLQSIVQNTTAFEHEEGGADRFIGSRTETALLDFARNYLDMGSVSIERSNADAIQVVPFDSNRKCTAVVVKLDHSRYRMYVKGASEILLGKCDRIVTDATTELAEATISADNREALKQVITTYATQSIRTISLVYRDFESWPPKDSHPNEDELSQSVFEDAFKRMTFLAVVGVQDPLQKSVREAVKNCKDAGVYVRMVTSENVSTARALAEECSILVHNEVIMEDPIFRRLSKHDIDATIPKLCVLARSSPEDKRKLVRCLKELGDTVAVTGDGTNDAPILKIADVGFSMGIAGTEVAQEASAIILIDDNFASIVNAFHWGRAVNEAAKGLLRSSVAARLLTIVPALAAFNQSSTLLAFLQLIGANLIMDTFAAIALDSKSVLARLRGRTGCVRKDSRSPTRRRRDPFLGWTLGHMAFGLFISGTAAQSTQVTADVNWRQRALDALSEIIVSCAVLLAPTTVLLIAGCIALILLWLEAEGTLALFMLGMACVFAAIRPAPESSGGDDDHYVRAAVGMAYTLFMLAYCRLVVLRNGYGKGFCTIAVILGALTTIVAMAFPAIGEYWVAFTHLNPTFALSFAIPSSFFLCDLAAYITRAVNRDNEDDQPTPSQLEIGSPAADPQSPRERAYRLRDISMRRFRSPYTFRSDDFDSDPEEIDSGDLPDDESSAMRPKRPITNRLATWISRVLSKRKNL